MSCVAIAEGRSVSHGSVLAITLPPSMMCTETILHVLISPFIIGEMETFGGNEGFLKERGMDLSIIRDPVMSR